MRSRFYFVPGLLLIFSLGSSSYAMKPVENATTKPSINDYNAILFIDLGALTLQDDYFDYLYNAKTIPAVDLGFDIKLHDHVAGILRISGYELKSEGQAEVSGDGGGAGVDYELTWTQFNIGVGPRYVLSSRVSSLYVGTGLDFVVYNQKGNLSAYFGESEASISGEWGDSLVGFYLEGGLKLMLTSFLEAQAGIAYHFAEATNEDNDDTLNIGGLYLAVGLGIRIF